MMPERIGLRMESLPEWRATVQRGLQTLRRTLTFPSHAAAMYFAGRLGDVCDEHPCLPRLEIRPCGLGGRIARVTVTITAGELLAEHYRLAHDVDATVLVSNDELWLGEAV